LAGRDLTETDQVGGQKVKWFKWFKWFAGACACTRWSTAPFR